MTNDEIRNAFHRTFEPAVSDVTPAQTLLTVVRRRHKRQQRLSTFGASLGVAAVTASALAGSMAVHAGNADDGTADATESAGTASSAPTRTLQTVSLVGHDLLLPGDWRLSGNRELIDLDTVEPGPAGGKDQSVTATSPDGSQQFEATVYSGPIAEIYRTNNSAEDLPTFEHVGINGLTASFHISGAPETCRRVDAPGDEPISLADAEELGTREVPCPDSVSANAPYGEVRYTFGNGDFMSVDTKGMDAQVLTTFLTTALSN